MSYTAYDKPQNQMEFEFILETKMKVWPNVYEKRGGGGGRVEMLMIGSSFVYQAQMNRP
jgi:hypothetical protein